MQIRVQTDPKKFGTCGCGRSPTGQCCGWHGLTEEAYRHTLMLYMEDAERADQETRDSQGSAE